MTTNETEKGSGKRKKKRRYMCHTCWNYKPCTCTLGWDYEMFESIGRAMYE